MAVERLIRTMFFLVALVLSLGAVGGARHLGSLDSGALPVASSAAVAAPVNGDTDQAADRMLSCSGDVCFSMAVMPTRERLFWSGHREQFRHVLPYIDPGPGAKPDPYPPKIRAL